MNLRIPARSLEPACFKVVLLRFDRAIADDIDDDLVISQCFLQSQEFRQITPLALVNLQNTQVLLR
jgi:hypothetical protein